MFCYCSFYPASLHHVRLEIDTILCPLSRNQNRMRTLSRSSRSPSPSPSPSHPPSWQRRLLGDRAASPARSVSPHPLPISPLAQRRVSSGVILRTPYNANRRWVTPHTKLPGSDAEGIRRSRSLDTGLGDESNTGDRTIKNAVSDSEDDDEVLVSSAPNTSAPKERPSRKDRGSVSRSKAAQTIVAAINQASTTTNNNTNTRKSRRSTTTDDEGDPQKRTLQRSASRIKSLTSK